jgi:Na+/H+ antiporter NhaD/arsenite permease-like protein
MTMRILTYAALVAFVALGTRWLRWTGAQVLATSVFAGFITGTLLFWKFRLAFALAGITALLATGVLDIPHLIEFASLDVILFLVAMMIVIGFMEERRFFEVVVEKSLAHLDRRAGLLLTALMVLAALSAALVDEVTSILFMSAVMDNVLAVATLIPVLGDLEGLGVFTRPMWWGLLFGGTFFGNLTMIGSTANIVALGILERDEGIHGRFGQWLAPGIVVAVPTLLLATLALFLQMPWMR